MNNESWGHSGECEKDCTCSVAQMFHFDSVVNNRQESFKCWCGEYEGTKKGLLTHQAMMHKTNPTEEQGEHI